MRVLFIPVFFFVLLISCTTKKDGTQAEIPIEDTIQKAFYEESRFRPQFHFSPKTNWMNDPNGMVYYEGEYHLFYQYHPESTVWGPMHWGHAVSEDLVSWEHLPIALYPDSLGYIFSGSVVVDWKNTSGFGADGESPLVAIFTHHDPIGEKADLIDFQYQSIAFSSDKGRTWNKYEGNPVLKNPGIKDFRDPKVFWHDETAKWVMILAEGDEVGLYGSQDLKEWLPLSKFGKNQGSHQGVWECPDLFKLADGDGNAQWVMIVSIGTGGQMGSATQYFVGDFDGTTFTNSRYPESTLWLDHGKDNYAGVTWSDIPYEDSRRLFIGWMSNWQYAQVLPTDEWRSAMTIPRELRLYNTPNGFQVSSYPVEELRHIRIDSSEIRKTLIAGFGDFTNKINRSKSLLNLEMTITQVRNRFNWRLVFSNSKNEELIVGFNDRRNQFYIDRKNAGDNSFSEDFAGIHYGTRYTDGPHIPMSLWLDRSSIEVFFDGGRTVFTELIFPSEPYTKLKIETEGDAVLATGMSYHLQSVW